jgi:hypothetical protein
MFSTANTGETVWTHGPNSEAAIMPSSTTPNHGNFPQLFLPGIALARTFIGQCD